MQIKPPPVPNEGSETMDSEAHEKLSHQEILKMTAQIVSAYVSHNELPGSQIPEVIKSVYVTLESQKSGDAAAAQERSEERRAGKECRSRWSPYH